MRSLALLEHPKWKDGNLVPFSRGVNCLLTCLHHVRMIIRVYAYVNKYIFIRYKVRSSNMWLDVRMEAIWSTGLEILQRWSSSGRGWRLKQVIAWRRKGIKSLSGGRHRALMGHHCTVNGLLKQRQWSSERRSQDSPPSCSHTSSKGWRNTLRFYFCVLPTAASWSGHNSFSF